MQKKILVILGHPDSDSLCAALARAYVKGAKASGAEVRSLNLGELEFDPVLWKGYHSIQQLEPDLVEAQDLIKWSDHLVFVYPNWWGAIPALMKGFFDRVFLPGFAFRYRENSQFWDKLLAGRSAQLIVTMDTPPWYYRWLYRQPGHNQMKRTILGFCGIKVVKITELGIVRNAVPEKIEQWISEIERLGSEVR